VCWPGLAVLLQGGRQQTTTLGLRQSRHGHVRWARLAVLQTVWWGRHQQCWVGVTAVIGTCAAPGLRSQQHKAGEWVCDAQQQRHITSRHLSPGDSRRALWTAPVLGRDLFQPADSTDCQTHLWHWWRLLAAHVCAFVARL
jgi:hypothetical protein